MSSKRHNTQKVPSEWLKGRDEIKLSSFTHVVANLYEFISTSEHKRKYSEECFKSVCPHSVNGVQNSTEPS